MIRFLRNPAAAALIASILSILISCGSFSFASLGLDPEGTGGADGTANGTADPGSSPQAGSTSADRAEDSERWDLAVLDTAADASWLEPIEQDVILEMNKVRSDPKQYAEMYIRPLLEQFRGRILYRDETGVMTQEGAAAVEEALRVLSRTEPVGIFEPHLGLSRAAADHVQDQGPKGATGHRGSDGSDPLARAMRYIDEYRALGENISYGPDTAREIVVSLLVDDGVPSRGHRNSIMNPQFTETGVAYGPHSAYRHMCVIVYGRFP